MKFALEDWLWVKTPKDRVAALRVFDSGRPRSLANNLEIMGLHSATLQGAIARQLATWKTWLDQGSTRSTTPGSVAQYVTRTRVYAEIDGPDRGAITAGAMYVHSIPQHGVGVTPLGFAHVICGKKSAKDRDAFFGRFQDVATFRGHDAICGQLLRTLSVMAARNRRDRMWTIPALVVKAWNRFRSGDTKDDARFTLTWNSGEMFPEVQ
jgi:hypothetical protein